MWGMKNRFQVPGVRGQGRKSRCQVLGFRIQDSGVRSQKSGVRMESIWSPPTAYCLLSTAYSGRRWQVGNQKEVLGARGWGMKACAPPTRASIARSICPAAQESSANIEENFLF